MVQSKDIWVYVELDDNKPRQVAFELLSQAVLLAKKANERACAVLLCEDAGNLPEELLQAGADLVYIVSDSTLKEYNTEHFTNAFCELVSNYAPSAILIGATADGRDFAPRIAARLKTGLCADCTGLDIRPDGVVEWTRPALGGNILATIVCDAARPQMGTIRPKVFHAEPCGEGHSGEIIRYELKNKVEPRSKLVEKSVLTEQGAGNIEDAEIICSGGRGLGSAERFHELEILAGLLGGTVGGSRAVVDEGWIGHPQQVGQSGKTVTPKIYFAIGISGAIQHISGMHDAKVIIAINKDPNAPIFKVANYGIVGDINTLLPLLIEKVRALKEA